MTKEEVEEYWERKGKYLYEEKLNTRTFPDMKPISHVEFITEDEPHEDLGVFAVVFTAMILGL